MLHQPEGTSTPVQQPTPTLPQPQLDVTTSDLQELQQMERDVVNIEQLVNRKRKALDELKQIVEEEEKLRETLRVSYVVKLC